jgi:hypothetical protein
MGILPTSSSLVGKKTDCLNGWQLVEHVSIASFIILIFSVQNVSAKGGLFNCNQVATTSDKRSIDQLGNHLALEEAQQVRLTAI